MQLQKTLKYLVLQDINLYNIDFLSGLTHLTSLELISTNATNDTLAFIAKKCLKLQYFKIRCQFSYRFIKILYTLQIIFTAQNTIINIHSVRELNQLINEGLIALSNLPKLEKITIEDNYCISKDEGFKYFKILKSLELLHCENVSNENLKSLSKTALE